MQFIIVGVGGQGILFSSRVMGHLALARGEKVMGSEVHGMAQRGGSVISHFKMGDYDSPMIPEGSADVLVAFDQAEAFRNLSFLKEGGHVIINLDAPEALENKDLQSYLERRKISLHTLKGYDLLQAEMEGKFLFLNVVMLGALCGSGVGDFSLEAMQEALRELAPPKFLEANLKALELGYGSTRKE